MVIRTKEPPWDVEAPRAVLKDLAQGGVIPARIDRVELSRGLPLVEVQASSFRNALTAPDEPTAFRYLLLGTDYVAQIDLRTGDSPKWLGSAEGEEPIALLESCQRAEALATGGEHEAWIVDLTDIDLSYLLLAGESARLLRLAGYSEVPISPEEATAAVLGRAAWRAGQSAETVWES